MFLPRGGHIYPSVLLSPSRTLRKLPLSEVDRYLITFFVSAQSSGENAFFLLVYLQPPSAVDEK